MRINTLILGAGAAGMMCAAHAGGSTLVIDHAKAPGEKIRISGGGRCNFTNMYAEAKNYLSANPHFCKSALARYTQWDFIELVDRHGIAWHEKTLGQLFCDGSSKQIIAMLTQEMAQAGADLWLHTSVETVEQTADGYRVQLLREGKPHTVTCRNLVLATGGKSIPKMGATGLAYDLARQFGLEVTETRAGLVPFTFPDGRFQPLAGVSLSARLSNARTSFDEALLFTHRGLSGPSVLQLSSYWREGEEITVNLIPETPLYDLLREQRQAEGRRDLTTELSRHLPGKLVEFLKPQLELKGRLADQSDAALSALCEALQSWRLLPAGTEGYRTAEVTLGGICTDGLSSKTMEAKAVPGLYAIGEAVDVTGWLGGYNFQWAWASGHAAGTAIAAGR
ncbi:MULTISPECIES: NAD(P)/FAD-dependent oxidoreductase [unclassified Leisingera]|uniref:NAD(P)/FAD-dependent oxidoreductase n=1 Tax=unclassified Leisingera TaxID=2614906 RepID=UPI00030196E3|nr:MULTISPECIES: NAD(P)/FAD-dependent oxidoreductase [unclassified Leisingera]KIC23881.1 membrane protein [Leisingera sp. ANG-S3]KIC53409.1 membrane protein [Leisingera sp. ANG-S]KID08196.1 membrane protein [Leisingera sp. ANG1]